MGGNISPHKQWLDNEYAQWVKALQESTVHNFKEHPVVRRMLGEISRQPWIDLCKGGFTINGLDLIDSIGRKWDGEISGTGWRIIYYALEILKRNPTSICEIGGGAGQLYAVLRVFGYKGTYWIYDLPEVQQFQGLYLAEIEKQIGINLTQTYQEGYDMFVSFYALGEFDDFLKLCHKPLIDHCNHGYIAWNAHSGASDDLSIFNNRDIKVSFGVEPNIKIIEW